MKSRYVDLQCAEDCAQHMNMQSGNTTQHQLHTRCNPEAIDHMLASCNKCLSDVL
jgi:hypothetical protein